MMIEDDFPGPEDLRDMDHEDIMDLVAEAVRRVRNGERISANARGLLQEEPKEYERLMREVGGER